jgi:DNA-binding MarR family transcriptional regulator
MGVVTETRWLNEREALMWRAYVRMRRDLDTVIERQLGDEGLSTADYELLVPLSEAPDRVLRVRDLGRGVRWDRSRLAHQLRRMENRGLVRRYGCPTDARGTMVELTDDGRALIEAAAPGHVDTVRRCFVDLLDAEEMAMITSIAERVSAASASCPSAEASGDAAGSSCDGGAADIDGTGETSAGAVDGAGLPSASG